MYLRPHRRTKNGAVYEYWTLEESVRTPVGPRQRTVATLGKVPGLDAEVRMGWEHIRAVLDGRLGQDDLFRATPEPPVWARVDASRARVERLLRFGEVYVGLALARFCAPSSELRIAESWYGQTALDDLLGVAPEQVNEDRLYRALGALLPHKEGLFRHF